MMEHDIKIVIIDYLADANCRKTINHDFKVSEIVRETAIMKELNINIICLSQLSRDVERSRNWMHWVNRPANLIIANNEMAPQEK